MKKTLIVLLALTILTGAGCKQNYESKILIITDGPVVSPSTATIRIEPLSEFKIELINPVKYRICQNDKCGVFEDWYGDSKTGCRTGYRKNYSEQFCGSFSMETIKE